MSKSEIRSARAGRGLVMLLAAWAVAGAPAPAAVEAPGTAAGAGPADGAVTMTLRELWRVGGDDEDQLFGVIGTVLAGENGDLYLLDTQLSQVQVYSPRGEHLRTLGRPGQGPGEIERPSGMFFAPDGRVALIQAFPGRVVMIDRENNPAGGFLVGGGDPQQGRFGVIVAGGSGGGHVYLAGMQMSMTPQGLSEQDYYFAAGDLEGRLLHTFAGKRHTINYADLVIDESGIDFVWNGRWAVDGSGRVYLAPDRNRYRIQVFAPDGSLEREIEREYKSWKRSGEEQQVARRQLQAIARNYPMPARELTTLDTEPDITALHCRPDGALWVGTSRGERERPEGVFCGLDEFDAAGRFTRRVMLAGEWDPRRDALFLVGPERAVVVTGALDAYLQMQGVTGEAGEAETEPLQVIYCALER